MHGMQEDAHARKRLESQKVRTGEGVRMKDLVRMPKSKFYRVVCRKCRKDQVVYNKIATVVKCLHCGEVLAVPTGGQAFIKGKVVESFG